MTTFSQTVETENTRPMRASDADRMGTVIVLQDAVTRGLLTHTEGEERMAAAYATTHRHELPPLTADLPPAEPERPPLPRFSAVGRVALQLWLHLVSVLARLPRRVKIAGAVLVVLLVVAVIGFGMVQPFHSGPAGDPDAAGLPRLHD